jgi:flavin-dependent dehydrogenase
VLVVGAGPAGADLAGSLARSGVAVVLVDRLACLQQAAFSSAALPLKTLSQYGLPAEVVAARWHGWQLLGPQGQRRHWHHGMPLGAVLDFGALRQWMVEQVRRWGGQVQLGTTAVRCWPVEGGLITTLRHTGACTSEVFSHWVVDASGQQRALLGEPPASTPLVEGLGLEWLLAVEPAQWQPWADQLSFALGSGWVAQGYGWIFPMQPGQLKVGVCRLLDQRRRQRPLGSELAALLARCGLAGARVLDRHGGRIRSSISRREPHRRGRLLGLGDAVSTANLLGGEGIRHALASSRSLQPLLLRAVERQRRGAPERQQLALLDAYPQQLRQSLGWRWTASGRLARRTWLGLVGPAADARLNRLLTGLESCRAEDLSALLFDYRFERYGLRCLPYLLGVR